MHVDSILSCSNTLHMPNMDVGSSLRWPSGSTMTYSHYFDSSSDPEPKNLCQVGWVKLCKAATICQWTAYQCAQILCICLKWMWQAVWGDCQPQPWHNLIVLTQQVTQSPKIWAKQGGYNCVRLILYDHGQHINVLNHFVCVQCRDGKHFEVAVSINYGKKCIILTPLVTTYPKIWAK